MQAFLLSGSTDADAISASLLLFTGAWLPSPGSKPLHHRCAQVWR